MARKAFNDLRRGDRIRFLGYGGLSIKGGKTVRDRVVQKGTVVFGPADSGLLSTDSPDRVTVNMGGKHGTPQVVDRLMYECAPFTAAEFKDLARNADGRIVELAEVFECLTPDQVAKLHDDDASYYEELQEEVRCMVDEVMA